MSSCWLFVFDAAEIRATITIYEFLSCMLNVCAMDGVGSDLGCNTYLQAK